MIREGAGCNQCFSDSSNGNISTFPFNVFPSTVRMCSAQRLARLSHLVLSRLRSSDVPRQPKREPFKEATTDAATDHVSPPDPLLPPTCTLAAQLPTESHPFSYKAPSQGSQRKAAQTSEPQPISSKHRRWCLNDSLPRFGR